MTVKQFIEETFLVKFENGVDEKTNLFKGGFIDSYGFIELVAFLESSHHIKITEEELTSGQLSSLEKIAAFIERKRA